MDDSEQVKKLLSEKMSDKYDVSTPEMNRPRIKIVQIVDELNDVGLLDTLKKQNKFLENSEVKVINFFRIAIRVTLQLWNLTQNRSKIV